MSERIAGSPMTGLYSQLKTLVVDGSVKNQSELGRSHDSAMRRADATSSQRAPAVARAMIGGTVDFRA